MRWAEKLLLLHPFGWPIYAYRQHTRKKREREQMVLETFSYKADKIYDAAFASDEMIRESGCLEETR